MVFLNFLQLEVYLLYSFFYLFIGLAGIFTFKKNLILILVSLEIMFLSSHMNFLLFSLILDNIVGYIFSIFIIVVGGSEVSVGLALVILLYRIRKNIFLKSFSLYKI